MKSFISVVFLALFIPQSIMASDEFELRFLNTSPIDGRKFAIDDQTLGLVSSENIGRPNLYRIVLSTYSEDFSQLTRASTIALEGRSLDSFMPVSPFLIKRVRDRLLLFFTTSEHIDGGDDLRTWLNFYDITDIAAPLHVTSLPYDRPFWPSYWQVLGLEILEYGNSLVFEMHEYESRQLQPNRQWIGINEINLTTQNLRVINRVETSYGQSSNLFYNNHRRLKVLGNTVFDLSDPPNISAIPIESNEENNYCPNQSGPQIIKARGKIFLINSCYYYRPNSALIDLNRGALRVVDLTDLTDINTEFRPTTWLMLLRDMFYSSNTLRLQATIPRQYNGADDLLSNIIFPDWEPGTVQEINHQECVLPWIGRSRGLRKHVNLDLAGRKFMAYVTHQNSRPLKLVLLELESEDCAKVHATFEDTEKLTGYMEHFSIAGRTILALGRNFFEVGSGFE